MIPCWTKEHGEKPHKTALIMKNGKILLEKLITVFDGKRNPISNFSSEELNLATNNYDAANVTIDYGDYKLYKGFIRDRRISVMKFNSYSEHAYDICINNILFASQMCHKHILKLIGYCLDTQIPVLVFESLAKYGTLRDHIHSHHQPEFESLSWRQRLKIVMEIANAFSYLHFGFSRPIVYSFTSPAHVLLDAHYVPKLFEFSYAECIPEGETQIKNTQIRGVIGYIAPEHTTGVLNEKCDVYGFGVMLLQLLTGLKRPLNSCETLYEEYFKLKSSSETKDEGIENNSETLEEDLDCNSEKKYEHWLPKFVKKIIEDNRFIELVDPIIVEHGLCPETERQMKVFAELAVKCLSVSPEERPTMIEVAKRLRQLYLSA